MARIAATNSAGAPILGSGTTMGSAVRASAARIRSKRRVDQGPRVGLVLELGRVNPNQDKGVGEPVFQRSQLIQDVQAVHATKGPEVENHDATTQIGQAQRVSAGVQPTTADQLGSPNPDPGQAHVGSVAAGCGGAVPSGSRRSPSTGKLAR